MEVPWPSPVIAIVAFTPAPLSKISRDVVSLVAAVGIGTCFRQRGGLSVAGTLRGGRGGCVRFTRSFSCFFIGIENVGVCIRVILGGKIKFFTNIVDDFT